MKDRNNYSIQSPIGIFKNINDAITQYPYIAEDKKISQCPICKEYFIKYGKEDNNRKYCSEECSGEYLRIYKNIYNSAWNRDKWLRESNQTKLADKENRRRNWEYHQDDTFWGLGESNLREHPKEDFEHEHNLIRKEKQRLYGRWNNEKLS